jgi:hypothetical protein
VVVQLGIAGAMVLVAGGLSMGFLGQWCHIVVESIGEFHIVIVEGIGGVVFGYVAEVGEVDWGCFGGATARMEALASVPVGEGSQWCTGAMRALLFLY